MSEPVAPVFDRIEDILVDLAAGKMVVIVDDEDRENEGDLLMAAEKVRPRTSTSWRASAAGSSA